MTTTENPRERAEDLDEARLRLLRRRRMILALIEGGATAIAAFCACRWGLPLSRFLPFESEETRSLATSFIAALLMLLAFAAFRSLANLALRRGEKAREDAAARWVTEGRGLIAKNGEILSLFDSLLPRHNRESPAQSGDSGGAAELAILRRFIETAKGMEKKNGVVEENRDRIQSFLAALPRLTELLRAQLTQTNRTTEAAALDIMGKLTEVKKETSLLLVALEEVKTRTDALHGETKTRIDESRGLMKEIDGYRLRIDRQIQVFGSSIESVVTQLAELKTFTGMIRDMTGQANIVAINAAIEATRAGNAGRGFSVVASEVRKLTKEIESIALRIEGKYQEVSTTVNGQLRAMTLQIQSGDEARWLASLSSALPRLSGDFESVVGELDKFAKSTHTTVHTVSDSILDVLSSAQFQDIARQQIEQVQTGLTLFGEQLSEMARIMSQDWTEDIDTSVLEDIAETLREGYTMLLQHKIHHSIVGGAPVRAEAARPSIELF